MRKIEGKTGTIGKLYGLAPECIRGGALDRPPDDVPILKLSKVNFLTSSSHKSTIGYTMSNRSKLFTLFTLILFAGFSSEALATTTFRAGAGQTYATVSAAYNAIPATITDDYVILVYGANDSIIQTTTLTISARNGLSATNTITIKPGAGQSPRISVNAQFAVRIMEGASYVSLDGDNGDGNRSLSIENSNTANFDRSAVYLSSNNVNTKFVTVRSCNIITAAPGNNWVCRQAIYFRRDIDSCSFINNYLDFNTQRFGHAIYVNGTANFSVNNTIIRDNVVKMTTTNHGDELRGITVEYNINPEISGNTVNGNGYSCGIAIENCDGNQIKIYNNTLSGYSAHGLRTDNSQTTSKHYVYYNTLYSTSDVTTLPLRYPKGILVNAYGVTFMNNIVINNGDNAWAYCIYAGNSAKRDSFISDFNCLYAKYSNGRIGYWGGAESTFAQWQTASSQDSLSVNALPPFVDTLVASRDMHIDTTDASCVIFDGRGETITGYSVDIDGDARNNPNPGPDFGSDEFTGPASVNNGNAISTAFSPLCATCDDSSYFSVQYTHTMNIAPDSAVIYVDGTRYNLTAGGNNFPQGVTYSYKAAQLALGTHPYRFYFVVSGRPFNEPVSGTDTLNVFIIDSANAVSTAFDPVCTTCDDSTSFSVRYTNTWFNIPDTAVVYIDGVRHDLTVGDIDLNTGVHDYYYTDDQFAFGQYAYRFHFVVAGRPYDEPCTGTDTLNVVVIFTTLSLMMVLFTEKFAVPLT